MEKPKKLADLIAIDLAGFLLVRAYFLELSHGLMGFFPAIFAKDGEMVVCLDKALLEKVWDLLPKRRAEVGEALLLVSPKDSFGFDVRNDQKEDVEPVHILTQEEFDSLTKEYDLPFKWVSGLISGCSGPVESPFGAGCGE
jgi:hypothetical protein